jgi:hypothetical protein
MCVPVSVTTAGVISAGGATLASLYVVLAILGGILIVNFRHKIRALLR